MSPRDFSERDIHLALDGELPQDERAAYDAWLDATPAMKARAGRLADDVALLQAAVSPVEIEPLPKRFIGMLEGRAPSQAAAPMGRWWMATAAAALLTIGLGGGYLLGSGAISSGDDAAEAFAERAINAHIVYAAEKRHVVEVGANDRDHLQQWLSNRLKMKLVAPDLTRRGFTLIGGRLLPAGANSAAQFMYENATGNRLSLYVGNEGTAQETGLLNYTEGSARAAYWLGEGYDCALIGDLPEGEMNELAHDAWGQLDRTFKG